MHTLLMLHYITLLFVMALDCLVGTKTERKSHKCIVVLQTVLLSSARISVLIYYDPPHVCVTTTDVYYKSRYNTRMYTIIDN